MRRVTLSGVGLHTGAVSRVRLSRTLGATCLVQAGKRCSLADLRVKRTDHGVCVSDREGRLAVELVEHLFAALSVLQARNSVEVDVLGPELPLLDGAARRWLEALIQIGVSPGPATHRIVQSACYELGASHYELTPQPTTSVEVVTHFGPGIGTQHATFDGSLEHFENAIAGARTFGFARDAVRLKRKGRAAHIDPNSVLVFRDDGSLALPTKPATENELAAHKLLDLLGDALLYGALPRGRIYARCPGHTNNHAMFQRALREGVIVDGSLSSHSYVFKDSAACTS